MEKDKNMILSVYRFNPECDTEPYFKNYSVDLNQVKGNMLLNVLEYIKEEDPTLSLRRSCGEGVCGSDGININGRNGLSCITRLSSLPNFVVIQPLPGFPVIRDLVVDMTQFFEQYKKVRPYLINKKNHTQTERLQKPEDRKKLDGLYECILCACCSSACPSYWWNPELFIGPAGLLAAYRFIIDTRDTEFKDRLNDLKDPYSIFRCRSIMGCVDVCPKGLNPTKAIQKIRSKMLYS